ncbi:hypothetical protein F5880DRAFT_1004036 [Lentinula raphanica]|nr:hypothetical protein F5880DRAFT_1004036 [Lentinula raphanica]
MAWWSASLETTTLNFTSHLLTMFKFALKAVLALLTTQALLMGASATCTSNSDVPAVKSAAQDYPLILPDAESLCQVALGLDLNAKLFQGIL